LRTARRELRELRFKRRCALAPLGWDRDRGSDKRETRVDEVGPDRGCAGV